MQENFLTDDEPEIYLIREPEPIASISKYGAFIERFDENLIIAGTFYYMNGFEIADKGDFVSDLDMTILFNNELKNRKKLQIFTLTIPK